MFFRKLLNRILSNKEVFIDFLVFGGSTFFEQGSRLLMNFLIALWLGPYALGTWYVLNLILRYGVFAHFGALQGLNREISMNLKNESFKSNMNGYTLSISLFILLIHILLYLILWLIHDLKIIQGGFFEISLCVFLSYVVQLFGIIKNQLRAEIQLVFLGKIQWFFALLWLLLGLFATYYYGLKGFLISSISSNLIAIFVYKIFNEREKKAEITKFQIKPLLNFIYIGFPIMLVGFSYTIMSTIDRLIILSTFGTETLGYYSVSSMLFSALSMIVLLFSQIFYPRMLKSWSEEQNISKLKSLLKKQQIISLALVIPSSVLAYFIIPFIIKNYFLEYSRSILSIQIICFIPIFLAISNSYGNLFNTLNKQYKYLMIVLGAALLNLILGFLFVKLGYNIEGVAFSTLLAYVFYTIINVFLGLNYLNRMKKYVSTSSSC